MTAAPFKTPIAAPAKVYFIALVFIATASSPALRAIMIYDLVPMAHVASVNRSIEFYARLGFEVRSRLGEPEAFWAALQSGQAIIMFSRASEPIVPAQQAVLFYLYTADVLSLRQRLLAAGITVSDIAFPPYMPAGEMRVTDPDGYCLLIGQSDMWTRSRS